jgi:hypothetical protein
MTPFTLSLWSTTTVLLISIIIRRYLQKSQTPQRPNIDPTDISHATDTLSKKLALALPSSVILPEAIDAFKQVTDYYWAKQEREVVSACIVRPCDVQELSMAVTILRSEFTETGKIW